MRNVAVERFSAPSWPGVGSALGFYSKLRKSVAADADAPIQANSLLQEAAEAAESWLLLCSLCGLL
jgi:hypothetical protein